MLKIAFLSLIVNTASAEPSLWKFLGDIYNDIIDNVNGDLEDTGENLKNDSETSIDYLDILEHFKHFMNDYEDYNRYYIITRDYVDKVQPDDSIDNIYDYTRYILYAAGDMAGQEDSSIDQAVVKEFQEVVDMYLDDMRILRAAGT